MSISSSSKRRSTATESFKTAAECIGTITPGMALFAMTRGQFSMIDAILACLDQAGPATLSLWTWVIADYETDVINRLLMDGRIRGATLIVDQSTRVNRTPILLDWIKRFGSDSVRIVVNHSKIACIESDTYKLLLRGSMNLNYNPRFEQFDVTEGGPDFDLVKQIESELPILPISAKSDEIHKASKLDMAFTPEQLGLFGSLKGWTK